MTRRRGALRTCRDCKVRVRRFKGYWRDRSPDPGDGFGGDANCQARFTVKDGNRPHRVRRAKVRS